MTFYWQTFISNVICKLKGKICPNLKHKQNIDGRTDGRTERETVNRHIARQADIAFSSPYYSSNFSTIYLFSQKTSFKYLSNVRGAFCQVKTHFQSFLRRYLKRASGPHQLPPFLPLHLRFLGLSTLIGICQITLFCLKCL